MNLPNAHSHHALSSFSPRPSRRALVTGVGAGARVLPPPLSLQAPNGPQQPPDNPAGQFAPNAFIRIDHAGKTTLVMPQVEMGQGTYTSISMILAEELDADWSLVRVEHAPADEKLYANPDLGCQGTGDSTSIRAFWKPLRLAGAATRACFIEAAAHSWGVSTAECRTENSKIIHDQSGRTLDYGALVGRAPESPATQRGQRVPIDRSIAKAPRHSRQGQW